LLQPERSIRRSMPESLHGSSHARRAMRMFALARSRRSTARRVHSGLSIGHVEESPPGFQPTRSAGFRPKDRCPGAGRCDADRVLRDPVHHVAAAAFGGESPRSAPVDSSRECRSTRQRANSSQARPKRRARADPEPHASKPARTARHKVCRRCSLRLRLSPVMDFSAVQTGARLTRAHSPLLRSIANLPQRLAARVSGGATASSHHVDSLPLSRSLA
jgi:hypothetical protein